MSYIIITKKIWDKNNFKKIKKNFKILNKINLKVIRKINPKIIFFIHWSTFINKNIYNKYLCIQFHSSNLPMGRGGSPIQNQILLGLKSTKLTAFKISQKLDAGPVCLKSSLKLNGRAIDIYKRIEKQSIKMIRRIIKLKKINFYEQNGKHSYFTRRKKIQSKIDIKKFNNLNKLYDFLRMLDAPGYPYAYTELKNFKITFKNIKKIKKILEAEINIEKK